MENKQQKNTYTESIFSRFSAWMLLKLKTGIFGHFFTSYDSANEKFKRGIKKTRKKESKKRTKRTIARTIESNPLVKAGPKIHEFLLRVALRDYGIIIFTVALMNCALFFIQDQIPILSSSLSSLITAAVIAVFAIPMLFSGKPIASLLFKGRLCHSVLFSFLGISDDIYRDSAEEKAHSSPSIALLCGIILSVLSYFSGLLWTIGIIALIFLAYHILITPEIGIIAMLLSLPFTSVFVMGVLGLYVTFCYIIKCVIGRRVFKPELVDFWMLIALAVIIYGGFVSLDIASSAERMLLIVLLFSAFFIVSNLIRSKEWYKRCIASFCISSTIASSIAIAQFILGKLDITLDGWQAFSTIHERVCSTFPTPEGFAFYTIGCIPFLLLFIFSGKSATIKTIGVICGLINMAALTFTFSKAGYIGAIAMLALMLLVFNRNNIYLIAGVAIAVIILNNTLPAEFLNQIHSLITLPTDAHDYRLFAFSSSIDMIKEYPFGIGIGNISFSKAFAETVGVGNMQNTGNLYLQIALSCGILGLLLILCAVVVVLRLVLSYCAKTPTGSHRINALAGFGGAFGIFIAGFYSFSLDDITVISLVSIILALTFAYIKIERDRYDSLNKCRVADFLCASIDIELDKNSGREYVPTRKYVHSPRRTKKRKEKTALDGIKSNELDPVIDDEVLGDI